MWGDKRRDKQENTYQSQVVHWMVWRCQIGHGIGASGLCRKGRIPACTLPGSFERLPDPHRRGMGKDTLHQKTMGSAYRETYSIWMEDSNCCKSLTVSSCPGIRFTAEPSVKFYTVAHHEVMRLTGSRARMIAEVISLALDS